MFRKTYCLILLLFMTLSLFAGEIDSSETIFERILISHGVSLTLGDELDSFGMGITFFRSLFFLEGKDMNGTYLIIFMTFPTLRLLHPDDVAIDDLRLGGIGYRGKTPISNLGFNVAISGAIGQRRIENTVYGDYYIGISPEVGLYFPHNSPIDVEITVAPMINLYNLNGSDVKNMSYVDIHLLVNFKEFFKKFKYPWVDEVK